jgi:hypothetical protein
VIDWRVVVGGACVWWVVVFGDRGLIYWVVMRHCLVIGAILYGS